MLTLSAPTCSEPDPDSKTCTKATKKEPTKEEQAAVIIQKAYQRYRYRPRFSCTNLLIKNSNNKVREEKNKMIVKLFSRNSVSKFHSSSAKEEDTETCRFICNSSVFQDDKESVIVFGGIDPHAEYGVGRNTGKDIFRFIPDKNVWEYVGQLPEPRYYHAVAFCKGRIYVAGGSNPRNEGRSRSKALATVWSFEPVSKCWYNETQMPTCRRHFGLIQANQHIYAIGGENNQKALNNVERYNPTGSFWEEVASMLQPRFGAACTKYKECIWATGGMSASGMKFILESVESYNIKYNQWTEITKLTSPRAFACLYLFETRLYIIGGASKIEGTKVSCSIPLVEIWDEQEDRWKLFRELSMPRHGHQVANMGTQLLVIGGVTTAYQRALSNVECYCKERDFWVRGIACLPSPLTGHAVVTLPPANLLP